MLLTEYVQMLHVMAEALRAEGYVVYSDSEKYRMVIIDKDLGTVIAILNVRAE